LDIVKNYRIFSVIKFSYDRNKRTINLQHNNY
jgi:hypothetical protein